MEIGMLSNIAAVLLFALLGAVLLLRSRMRTASDVLLDLEDLINSTEEQRLKKKAEGLAASDGLLNDQLGAMGLFDPEKRLKFVIINKLIPIIVSVFLLLLRILLGAGSLLGLAVVCILGVTLGFMLVKIRIRLRQARYQRSLEYHLPIVMERIVMAVEAGLDVIPAIGSMLDLERSACANLETAQLDPVTYLFQMVHKLSESGLGFEQSLQEVADRVDCSALKHAFVHLALAHKEGGELIMPLRELSDSTQLYYQETIEEEISKLPVKATMPLLCTFAGLIICFITTPLVQVMKITGQVMLE